MNRILKNAFLTIAVGGLLASIGCTAQTGEPTGGTAQAETAGAAPAQGRAPHWERVKAEDPIEDLRSVSPEEKAADHDATQCRSPLIPCGYCEGYIFCTTFAICERVCGDRG
jgi:hypothetical protein